MYAAVPLRWFLSVPAPVLVLELERYFWDPGTDPIDTPYKLIIYFLGNTGGVVAGTIVNIKPLRGGDGYSREAFINLKPFLEVDHF